MSIRERALLLATKLANKGYDIGRIADKVANELNINTRLASMATGQALRYAFNPKSRKHWDYDPVISEYDDDMPYDDLCTIPFVERRKNPMERKLSLAAIVGALKSPKTPAHLKAGLMKKYGHLLKGAKLPVSAYASTIRGNPAKPFGAIVAKATARAKKQDAGKHIRKSRKRDLQLSGGRRIDPQSYEFQQALYDMKKRGLINPRKRLSKQTVGDIDKYDIFVDKERFKNKEWYIVSYPAKKYIGRIRTKQQLDAFLKPAKAIGLKILYSF